MIALAQQSVSGTYKIKTEPSNHSQEDLCSQFALRDMFEETRASVFTLAANLCLIFI